MSEITLKDLLHGKKWKEFISSIFKDKDEDNLESIWQKAIREQEQEIKAYKEETAQVLKSIDEMNNEELLRFIAKTLYEWSRKL